MLSYLLSKQGQKRPGAATARIHSIPAPIGGWNVRDALQAMKPDDAVVLDNVIPGVGSVFVRPGFETWSTGLTGTHVETLMEYSPADSASVLFAATPSNIFDVTAGGAVGAASVTGLTNGRWQSVMFATTGGHFLCIVNGADNYRTYDSSGGWVDRSASVTGVTSSDLSNIAVHASRLWFVKDGSLSAYYLPAAAVQGAATELPLGGLCRKGGQLLALGSWTKDGGDGMDDLLVAVTSMGEVVVYQGTDPADAATWAKVGVFEVSEPIGKRCLVKVGGDIGILTSTGLALLSKVVGANRSGQGKVAITNKISGAFAEAYRQSGTAHGWQVIEFPRQSLVIVNLPVSVERSTAYQFVINIETGGWCRFTGIAANCWSLFGDDMYFGTSSSTVCKFGDAFDDDGSYIDWTIQTAYNKIGSVANKTFKMARPLMRAASGYTPALQILTDYEAGSSSLTAPTFNDPFTSEWDVAEWDVSGWGVTLVKRDTWMSVNGSGRALSVLMYGSVKDVTFEFNEIDVLYETGGVL